MHVTSHQEWINQYHKTVPDMIRNRDKIITQQTREKIAAIIISSVVSSALMYPGLCTFKSLGARSFYVILGTASFSHLAYYIYEHKKSISRQSQYRTIFSNIERKDFDAACTALIAHKELAPNYFADKSFYFTKPTKAAIYFLHLYAKQNNFDEASRIEEIATNTLAVDALPRQLSPDAPILDWSFSS